MDLNKIVDGIKAKSAERDQILGKADFCGDDLAKVKSINDAIIVAKSQYEAIKTAQDEKAWLSEPVNELPGNVHYAKAGHADIERSRQSMEVNQIGEGTFTKSVWTHMNTDGYKQAFHEYLRKGITGMGATARKDLEVGLDPQGGYFVTPEIINRVVSRLATPTRVAGLVTQLSTSRDAVEMPKVNYVDSNDIYSTGFRVTYTGEQPSTDEGLVDDADLFGQTRIDVYTGMMKSRITRNMLEDAAIDIQGWIADKFDETIALERDRMILSGSGVNQPLGILSAIGTADAPRIVNSGSASALTADGLIDLIDTLPEQYNENIRVVMNRVSTKRSVDKLKDQQLRYLFAYGYQDSGLAGSRVDTLLGYPVIYSGFMPNVAANAYPVISGDWSGYYLVNRLGLSIQVLLERYAENNKVGLVGRFRHGGRPVENWKLIAHKVST